ncbi:hypothetical protein Tco_0927733 [Tanacetum coccineum]
MMKAAAGRYETTSLRYPPPRGSNSGRNRCRELTNTATTVAAANCCAHRCGSNVKRFGMGCYSFQRFMRQEVWNDCRSCKVRVGSNGNLLCEASVLLDRKKVLQQRGSGAKRKLSRCGRNQMGNEPILALPKGANDFVVYYDVRSNDLEACLEKGRSEFDFKAKYHLGKANVDVVPWSRKKE